MNFLKQKPVVLFLFLFLVLNLLLSTYTILSKQQKTTSSQLTPSQSRRLDNETKITTTPILTKKGADLSYVMISADKDIEILVTHAVGKNVGESYIEGPIVPPGATSTPMKARKVFNYSKPASGNYTVSLSAPTKQAYNFEIYLYDKEGNPKVEKFTKSLPQTLKIVFDKENSKNSTIKAQ